MFRRERLPDPQTYYEAEGLTLVGPPRSTWRTTTCVFHGGGTTMRLNLQSGGWVCMSCFAKGGDVVSYQMQAHGQEFAEACRALGCWDESPGGRSASQRPAQGPQRMSAREMIDVLRLESMVAYLVASDIRRNGRVSDHEYFRLTEAVRRLQGVTDQLTDTFGAARTPGQIQSL